MIMVEVKDGRCYNQYPRNMFLLVTMEVFSDGFAMLDVLLVISPSLFDMLLATEESFGT
jgi:hypothetical protein